MESAVWHGTAEHCSSARGDLLHGEVLEKSEFVQVLLSSRIWVIVFWAQLLSFFRWTPQSRNMKRIKKKKTAYQSWRGFLVSTEQWLLHCLFCFYNRTDRYHLITTCEVCFGPLDHTCTTDLPKVKIRFPFDSARSEW